jgi:hypothetical protein
MRIIFVGPSERDDPRVYEIFQQRVALTRRDEYDPSDYADPVPDSCVTTYKQFLANLQGHIGPLTEVGVVVPPSFGITEEQMLNGTWQGICQFHEDVLPRLRAQLRKAWNPDEEPLLHVDMGDCLSTLYAAYFGTLLGYSTSVTFHVPKPDTSFSIGGHSVYGQHRPLLRRRVAHDALARCQRVHVAHPDLAGALASLFPDLGLTYFGDPLTVVVSESESTTLSSLSGGT